MKRGVLLRALLFFCIWGLRRCAPRGVYFPLLYPTPPNFPKFPKFPKLPKDLGRLAVDGRPNFEF